MPDLKFSYVFFLESVRIIKKFKKEVFQSFMSKTKIPVFFCQIFLPFLPRDFFVLQYSEKKKAFKRHSQMLLPLLLHFPLSSYHFILNPYKMSLEIRCLLCACLCAAHAGSLWVLFCGIFGIFFVHVLVYATYFGT